MMMGGLMNDNDILLTVMEIERWVMKTLYKHQPPLRTNIETKK